MPQKPTAHASIAIAEGMSVWDLSTYNDSPLERAYVAATRALELDPGDYRSHAAYGATMRERGKHEKEACERHLAQYRASLPPSYDERLLFESHLRLCEREEDREHWRQGYRLIGLDV